MELDVHPVAEELPRELHRVVHSRRRGGSGRVLERHAVEGNARVHDHPEAVAVELGRVRSLVVDSGRQAHHRHDDLVVEPRVVDALAGPLEVVHVVQGVEVADRAHAVLLEHLRVKLDHVGALTLQADDVHAARERLQVGLGSGPAERVHHVERILLAVEVAALEPRAAAGLEPADACRVCLLDAGEEVFGENARADDGLEPVAERREHEFYVFLCHCGFAR